MEDSKNKINEISSDYIDLSILISTLWKSKLFISTITFIFAFGSVIFALNTPDRYQSSALLQVHSSSSNSITSSISSQFGGLASLAGISMPSGDVDKSYYTIETVMSRDFLRHLTTFDGVKENLVASIGYDINSKEVIYDEDVFQSAEKKWIRVPTSEREIEPTYLEVYKEYIKNISISKSKKSGYLSITFQHHSPVFAYEFLNLIINELNKASKEKDIEESKKALSYLETQFNNIEQKNIKESIRGLVDSQLQRLMLANIKDDYLVTPIDHPYVAEENFYPSRPLIAVVGTIIGLILSLLTVFFKEYLNSRKSK
jgi:uncharacterized protein involved in exopolysaccharide biosynthesis